MACAVTEGNNVQQHVLVRGNPASPGDPVTRRFPTIIAGDDQPKLTLFERLPKFRPCPVPSVSGTLPSSAARVVIGIGESRADMPCEWLFAAQPVIVLLRERPLAGR